MRIPPILFIGCVAIFSMAFVIFFILENFLNLNNVLEKMCSTQTAEEDEININKSRCQMNLMVSMLITYLFTFIIACFIGMTGYLMARNFRGTG